MNDDKQIAPTEDFATALKKISDYIYAQTAIVDKIRAEIDRQEKWLSQAGYTPYNTDIAFDAIRSALAERSDEEEEDDCADIYCENCRNNYNCIEYLEEQERMNEEDDE